MAFLLAPLPRPSGLQTVLAMLVSALSVPALVYVAWTWSKPDRQYDPSPFFDKDGWHAMRRALLPSAVTLPYMGIGVLVLSFWRSGPRWIVVPVVLGFVAFFSLFASVFLFNPPARLVRPSLRAAPGWVSARLAGTREKRQARMR